MEFLKRVSLPRMEVEAWRRNIRMLDSRNMVQEKSLCLVCWNCHVDQLLRKEDKEMFSGFVGSVQAGLWDGRKLASVVRSSRTVAENTVICIKIVRMPWKQAVPHQGLENQDLFLCFLVV